jgi:hypothetical protein
VVGLVDILRSTLNNAALRLERSGLLAACDGSLLNATSRTVLSAMAQISTLNLREKVAAFAKLLVVVCSRMGGHKTNHRESGERGEDHGIK